MHCYNKEIKKCNNLCKLKKYKLDNINNLCKDFNKGICTKDGAMCKFSHIRCDNFYNCSDINCPYGHLKKIKTDNKIKGYHWSDFNDMIQKENLNIEKIESNNKSSILPEKNELIDQLGYVTAVIERNKELIDNIEKVINIYKNNYDIKDNNDKWLNKMINNINILKKRQEKAELIKNNLEDSPIAQNIYKNNSFNYSTELSSSESDEE